MTFPEPVCEFGYSDEQVAALIGDARMPEFLSYMQPRTRTVCAGAEPCAQAHGVVSFVRDVKRFLG